MFENIIVQAASSQLKTDILAHRLAPSMLFFGPEASGKGSTAIELARALSCEHEEAPWSCTCSDCVRHRALIHPDLVILGPRNFAAEIAASRAAFFREPSSAAGRSLFIRSLRKLLARFSPSIWEYESKGGRTNPLSLLQSLEEGLDEFTQAQENDALEKISGALLKDAFKLEDECMGETVPIAQIRKAAWWSRLSPLGKRKTLIIENADRMKDEARNSLLKLLEEPPESINIVLTVPRRESLLQTILSRLRPYRFLARSAAEEQEIIRRIFRDPQAAPATASMAAQEEGSGALESGAKPGLVGAYLDSFLPQSPEKLLPLAAFFVAAVARAAAISAKSRDISPTLKALGSYCAPIAEAAEFERTASARELIAELISRSGNFEGRSFPRFLALTLDLVSWSLKQCGPDPTLIVCNDIWRKRLRETQSAYGVWNQRPELALESLFHQLKEDLAVA